MKGAVTGSPKGGALEGLRVLDLTLMLSGPYGTMLLADQGADVIKVEPPTGDVTRVIGPFKTTKEKEAFGGYFASINRGKRSIVIDLKKDEGYATNASRSQRRYEFGICEEEIDSYGKAGTIN